MKRNKERLKSIKITAAIFIIIAGVVYPFNTAWANPLKRVDRIVQQRIYFREINEKVFARTHIPNAGTQLNPLIPKSSGPVNPRVRGTPLFKILPKPENFDSEAFKANMEKLRGWTESKIGKKAVDTGIKIAKKITQKIKTTEKRREFKELLLAKVKEFAKNGREFLKAEHKREVTAPKLRLSVKKNLFDPDRARPGQFSHSPSPDFKKGSMF